MARQASDGGLEPEAPEHEDSSRASEDVQTPTLDPEAGSAARSPRPQGLDKRKSKFVSMPLLQEEIEAVTDAYATADESWSKTWSRLLVENYLQNYKWYFPRKDDTKPDAPKLTKAWAYYEHISKSWMEGYRLQVKILSRESHHCLFLTMKLQRWHVTSQTVRETIVRRLGQSQAKWNARRCSTVPSPLVNPI